MPHHQSSFFSYSTVKYTVDTIAAVFLLIVLTPIMLIVSIVIKLTSRGPVLFRQLRPGKNEVIFCLYKFRTMIDNASYAPEGSVDHNRLTPVGRFLRRASIDELPQLINILKQEMSFIGPRPLLVRYLPWYTEAERLRHKVRPGITGWAQVNGRNTISWEEKFRYDLEYVNNMSLAFDVKIVFLTLKKIFYKSEVIIAGATATTKALDLVRKESQRQC